MDRSTLDIAYRRTSYFVETPRVRLRLRVDEPNAALDRCLEEQGCGTWAYITAFNPLGVPRDEAANHAAQEKLQALLTDRGYRYFFGEGVGDDGVWPGEPSLLVLNIARGDAVAIARMFEQIAILVGTHGSAPELVYC